MNLQILLGKKIKALRNSKNLTQEEFSEIIGMNERSISAIESGRRFVSARTIEKISETMMISYSDLFNFDEKDTIKNDNTKTLVGELNSLTENEKEYFIKIIHLYRKTKNKKK